MEFFSFVDLIDPDADAPLVVKAQLHLFSAEEGGRKYGLKTSHRPNHNFDGPDNLEMYIGQIDFIKAEEMQPGEIADVIVRFIPGRGLEQNLTVGRKWRIQEGRHLVGEATVLEVIDAT